MHDDSSARVARGRRTTTIGDAFTAATWWHTQACVTPGRAEVPGAAIGADRPRPLAPS